MIEDTFQITNEQYGEGAILDEYNGSFSICSAQKGKDGKIYLRWAFPQVKDRKPGEKSIPWKITLGDKQQAITLIKSFLAALDGNTQTEKEPEAQKTGGYDPDSDIPF